MSVGRCEGWQCGGSLHESRQGGNSRKLVAGESLAFGRKSLSNKRKAYNSVSDHTGNRRSHVDAIADDEIGRDDRHLILHATALPPVLLPNYPDIGRLMRKPGVGLRCSLQRIVCDDELQTLHGLQAALERLARLDKVAEGLVVVGLDGERGIVGGGIEEW